MTDGFTALDAAYNAAGMRGDEQQINVLEKALEKYHAVLADWLRGQSAANVLGAALWYAQHGLPVFPLAYPSKVPMKGTNGLLDASTDEARVREMFHELAQQNIAIATGHAYDVIDVDTETGHTSIIGSIADDLAFLPEIQGVALTPRGMHFYVPVTGRGNTTAIFEGVDYRGMGGYVVAPPSYVVEPDKGIDGPYVWLLPPVAH